MNDMVTKFAEEADSLVNPASIPLMSQKFWLQVKGLPLAYMTQHMGQFIGNQIGDHVLTDQSKKGELLGSIMRIRVALNIATLLRRSLYYPYRARRSGLSWGMRSYQ
ncbi:hypothetical protein ACFX13_038648 [Malus domestica]